MRPRSERARRIDHHDFARLQAAGDLNGVGYFAADLHVSPLRQRETVYGSDVRGAVGVFFDITRLERLERVRQEFLSNVSHELRTPLTSIITFAETLQDGALENEQDMRIVGEAGSGPEALERADALKPDVVILDIELPGLDGYTEAARTVHTHRSAW